MRPDSGVQAAQAYRIDSRDDQRGRDEGEAKSGGRNRVVMYADSQVPPAGQPLPLANTNVLLG